MERHKALKEMALGYSLLAMAPEAFLMKGRGQIALRHLENIDGGMSVVGSSHQLSLSGSCRTKFISRRVRITPVMHEMLMAS